MDLLGLCSSSLCLQFATHLGVFRLSLDSPVKDMLHLEQVRSFPGDEWSLLQLWLY